MRHLADNDNVIPLRPAQRLLSPPAQPPQALDDPLQLLADRVFTHLEAAALRSQLTSSLELGALDQFLESELYSWRHRILCLQPWLIPLLEALPPCVTA